MPTCSVSVMLDSSNPFPAGGQLSGQVVVQTDASASCRALEVTLSWLTHGRAARVIQGSNTVLLFEGDWEPGTHQHAFTLPIPDRPLSYRGKVTNITWEVTARADIPWARDPTDTITVEVVRDPAQRDGSADMGDPPPELLPQRAAASMLGLLCIGAGGMVAYIGSALFSAGLGIGGLVALVGLGFVGVGASLLWREVKRVRQEQQFSTLELSASTQTARPGDELEVVASVGVKEPLEVGDAVISLRRRERVRVRKRNDEYETFAAEETFIERALWSAQWLSPAEPSTHTMHLRIPEDAAPTFHNSGTGISWWVVMTIPMLDGTEPVVQEIPLRIR